MTDQERLRKEHETIRNKVGFYNSKLETLKVAGKDARKLLDYVFVNDVGEMLVGEALYTSTLDDYGNMIDDLILFCRESEKFWMTTRNIDQLKKWLKDNLINRDINLKDINHLRRLLEGDVEDKNVNIEDLTDEKIVYAIQGPDSKAVLNVLVKDTIDNLGTFKFKDTTIEDIKVMVSRTGFTGELGYELHFDSKYTDKIVNAIKEKGKPYGIRELITKVTIESLPIEKGYIQKEDFEGANPVEVGLGWTVNCEKNFIGRERTCLLKKEGARRKLLGFTVEDRDAKVKKHNKVQLNDEQVGEVTTFTYGFTVEKYIGYAMVDKKAKKGDKIIIETSKGKVEAKLQERIFYDPNGEKIRG